MPIHLVSAEGKSLSLSSPEDFERYLGVKYLAHLGFSNEMVQWDVQKRVSKALGKSWITPQQKWLGQYYFKEIREGVGLDLTIAWIDEKVGYGVWTNRDIPAKTFIGEYTGTLRKRLFWGRWRNHYCFSYNIGEGRKSPYTIDAEKAGNYTRYINHGETDRIDAVSVYCDGYMHIIFYALKDIPAGMQLCYNYGDDYWSKRSKPLAL